MSEDAANVINGWGKGFTNINKWCETNSFPEKQLYRFLKKKGLVWSTVAGVNYINTTTLETNLTTEMTSSSAKKLNVSENTKKRLKKVKAANELFLKLLESSQNYVISDIQVVNDILKEAKTLDFVNDPKKI